MKSHLPPIWLVKVEARKRPLVFRQIGCNHRSQWCQIFLALLPSLVGKSARIVQWQRQKVFPSRAVDVLYNSELAFRRLIIVTTNDTVAEMKTDNKAKFMPRMLLRTIIPRHKAVSCWGHHRRRILNTGFETRAMRLGATMRTVLVTDTLPVTIRWQAR